MSRLERSAALCARGAVGEEEKRESEGMREGREWEGAVEGGERTAEHGEDLPCPFALYLLPSP